MPNYQDILKNFREQFQVLGPDKYSDIENPDLRYELAGQRAAGLKQGAATISNVISHNVQEDKKAAEAAAAAKAKKGFTKKYNKSGGFTFYDPDGNEVSPFAYSLANGVPLTEALQGSYDPRDQQFIEDYMAMSDDLASGRYDNKTAIQKLSQDYPMVFGMQGAGQGSYRQEKQQQGIQSAQQQYGDVQKMSWYSSSKNAIGGNKGVNNLFKEFYDAMPRMQSWDDANYMVQKIQASKGYQKLTQDQKKDLLQRMGGIADTMFPYVQARYNQNIGLF